MEKKLSYGLMLSLEEICLRRVAVIMSTQTDILASFDELNESGADDAFKNNTSKLGLPPLLKEQIKNLEIPVSSEIRDWIWSHDIYLNMTESVEIRILEHLCWTNLGTVDYRKTAESLIRHEILDNVKHYKLACLYCLEDYIPVLWEKLPKGNKKYFYKQKGPLQTAKSQLEHCWPYILKGGEAKLDYMLGRRVGNPTTFNQYAFEYSARKGNQTATEYFFRKLTNDERNNSICSTIKEVVMRRMDPNFFFDNFSKEKLSDTFYYLLCQMNPEQQLEIFKELPYSVLTCLLDWPWQDIFLDIAEVIWPFLSEIYFVDLLQNISERIRNGYNLTKLFQEFFRSSPGNLKKYFVSEEYLNDFSFHSVHNKFLMLQDFKTIEIIFRSVDSEDKNLLLFSGFYYQLLSECIEKGEWQLVETCLQETMLSKEDKQELRMMFLGFNFSNFLKNTNFNESKWNQIFELLN